MMQSPKLAIALAALLAATAPLAAQDAQSEESTAEEGTAADDAGADASEGDATSGDSEAPAATAPGGDLSTGQAVDENGEPVGEPYIREEHGDWQVRCVRTPQENDPCQLYQLLDDGQGSSVAEITIFPLPEGQQAAAGATIITPLETLLTEQVTLRVDGGSAKRYPFSFCTQQGCVSRIGLTADDLASFRAGSAGSIRIVPAAAPDQQVQLTLSLTGFTAGFNALSGE